MAPPVAKDASVLLCGYGFQPALPGMTEAIKLLFRLLSFFLLCLHLWGTWFYFKDCPPVSYRSLRWDICDLQSSEFGHVVEAGDGDAANVVVVQRSVKREGKNSLIWQIKSTTLNISS